MFGFGRRLRVIDLQGLIYVVPDIHGRLDLLLGAVERIERHAAGRRRQTLFLGDYVDRGPDSRGVVEYLMSAEQAGGVVCLRGNHEQMLVEAWRFGGPFAVRWLKNGGYPALHSWGGARAADISMIPEAQVEWMGSLPLLARDAHRIYVHAGIAPNRAPERQSEKTCLWIREAFLRAGASELPAHVVHGHTPVWEGKPEAAAPERLPHRTNLDTGAYFTDVLAVGVFDSAAPGGPLDILT